MNLFTLNRNKIRAELAILRYICSNIVYLYLLVNQDFYVNLNFLPVQIITFKMMLGPNTNL